MVETNPNRQPFIGEDARHTEIARLQQEVARLQQANANLQQTNTNLQQTNIDLEREIATIALPTIAQHGNLSEAAPHQSHAGETMGQSEELFRAISDATPILMILTQHLDGEIFYANPASTTGLGLDAKQLVGHKLKDFLADSTEYLRLHDTFTANGIVQHHELQIKRVDGSLFWGSASVCPLVLGGSQILLTTLFDISDRKQTEVALRQSEAKLRKQAQELKRHIEHRTTELQQAEEKYRSIFENAAEGIFQISPHGRYLNINLALAELYGYQSAEEFTATVTDVGQIYVRPRRHDELVTFMRAMGSISEAESEVYRKDGSTIWISENIRTIKDESGQVAYYEGSAWNVSDRRSAEEELRRQQRRSELLLLSVLPQPIAERLKRGEKNIADSFAEATVMFADIANFTQLSSQNSPIEVIELLNEIFSAFDAIADRYQLEKIKTIGDAYMVVGGVPTYLPGHIAAVADAALDMQRAIAQFTTKDNQPIALRIGIHTGPVVAGIIGTRKFIYDLWGDTVNIASRMESQGEIGRTQVTAAVYERLRKRYNLQERGTLSVKGKGEMLTYWLEGKARSGF
jgi:PAS domain S-box-containing protein